MYQNQNMLQDPKKLSEREATAQAMGITLSELAAAGAWAGLNRASIDADNVALMIPPAAYDGLRRSQKYQTSHGMAEPTLWGMQVFPGNHVDRMDMQAIGGIRITREHKKPRFRRWTRWPVVSKQSLDVHIEKIREWCKSKKSPWFQRQDVVRVCKIDVRLANMVIREAYAQGRMAPKKQGVGKWHQFKQPVQFQGTPNTQPNVFMKAMQAGVVSKQTALAEFGLDMSAEWKKLQAELDAAKNALTDNISLST